MSDPCSGTRDPRSGTGDPNGKLPNPNGKLPNPKGKLPNPKGKFPNPKGTVPRAKENRCFTKAKVIPEQGRHAFEESVFASLELKVTWLHQRPRSSYPRLDIARSWHDSISTRPECAISRLDLAEGRRSSEESTFRLHHVSDAFTARRRADRTLKLDVEEGKPAVPKTSFPFEQIFGVGDLGMGAVQEAKHASAKMRKLRPKAKPDCQGHWLGVRMLRLPDASGAPSGTKRWASSL